MRSIVVLPHPDGPTNATNSPARSVNATSWITSRRSPDAAMKALRAIVTSSRAEPPTGYASFKGLHQKCLDRQHDRREGQRVGENTCHIEQLKRNPDLESDAVRPPEQLHDENDLPYQREAGACRRREIGRELRQDDMAERGPARHPERQRHFVEAGI